MSISKTTFIYIGIIILAIIASFLVYTIYKQQFSKKQITAPNQSNTQSAPTPSATGSASAIQVPVKQTITLKPEGFDPQDITVSAGTQIVWVNESGEDTAISSNDYPANQILIQARFPNGATLSVILDQPGSYKYYNHLNPKQKGTVIVK